MKNRRIKLVLLSFPGLFFALLTSVITFNEWIQIGIIADEEMIESYHFGSEAMIGAGGEKYRSADAYAFSSAKWSLISLTSLILYALGLKKKKRTIIGFGYLSTLLIFIGLRLS